MNWAVWLGIGDARPCGAGPRETAADRPCDPPVAARKEEPPVPRAATKKGAAPDDAEAVAHSNRGCNSNTVTAKDEEAPPTPGAAEGEGTSDSSESAAEETRSPSASTAAASTEAQGAGATARGGVRGRTHRVAEEEEASEADGSADVRRHGRRAPNKAEGATAMAAENATSAAEKEGAVAHRKHDMSATSAAGGAAAELFRALPTGRASSGPEKVVPATTTTAPGARPPGGTPADAPEDDTRAAAVARCRAVILAHLAGTVRRAASAPALAKQMRRRGALGPRDRDAPALGEALRALVRDGALTRDRSTYHLAAPRPAVGAAGGAVGGRRRRRAPPGRDGAREVGDEGGDATATARETSARSEARGGAADAAEEAHTGVASPTRGETAAAVPGVGAVPDAEDSKVRAKYASQRRAACHP